MAKMKSKLQEEAEESSQSPTRYRGTWKVCGVTEFLDSLTDEERPVIETLIDNREIDASFVHSLLVKHGLTVSVFQLRRHRGRGIQKSSCQCPRESK